MTLRALRATTIHLAAVAKLFDAYRGFYGQPSNLEQSRAFIAERMAGNESAIFLVEDESGEALGFVQLYPTFSSIDAHRTGCSAICSPRRPPEVVESDDC